VRFSFIRQFINTYLNIDGTPFTSIAGYQTKTFQEETKNRDKRLSQTIRTPGYKRIQSGAQIAAPPAFTYTYTGYHPIKWSVDDVAMDGGALNTNAVHLFRYAEVLLNYAEAKAELGQLTDADWALTVGALRARAGITGGIATLPTVVDPYLSSVYFPGITSPVILEVRRDRGIELAMEGVPLLRHRSLGAWAAHGDGVARDLRAAGEHEHRSRREHRAGRELLHRRRSHGEPASQRHLHRGDRGRLQARQRHVGRDRVAERHQRKWDQKLYLYPIPESDLLTNPALKQNPGW
jgi:hypothetical protein